MEGNINIEQPVITPMAHLLSDMEAADMPGEAPAAEPEPANPPADEGAAPAETPAQPPLTDPGMPPIPNPPRNYVTREDLQASNNDLQQFILENLRAAQAVVPPAEQPPEEPAEEDLPFDMDAFYDDPGKAIAEAINKASDKKAAAAIAEMEGKLKPLLDQSKAAQLKETVRGVVNGFLSDTDDGNEYMQDVIEYIKQNNLDPSNPQSYVDGYRLAKIGRLDGKVKELEANRGKSLDDYLADEASVGQIVANEAIKKRIIENYLSGLRDGEKPAVIGGEGTGQFPAQPRNNPHTLRDAGQLLRRDLEG